MLRKVNIRSSRAFTLVELLVVIVIVSFGLLLLTNTNSGDGAKLSSAGRTLSGLAKSARAQAILKNAEVRLIIHNDPSDIERYRRFVGIVYFGQDRDGSTGWVAATKGTFLPKGIYFDSETSAGLSGWLASGMTLDYPRQTAQDGGSGTDYLWYGFNDNGTAVVPNAFLVFRAGSPVLNGAATGVSEIQVSENQSGLVSGLILRTTGTVTMIDDPDAIAVSNTRKIN